MIKRVAIHYLRPPDHHTIYDQFILDEGPEGIVSFAPSAVLRSPVRVGDRVVLENGSPVVWFTFPDRWHDIGLFHLADGTFTGLYANVLTPVQIEPDLADGVSDGNEGGSEGEGEGEGEGEDKGEDGGERGSSIPGQIWRTTDLFLDVFRHPDGRVEVLDEAELAQAVAAGAVDAVLADRARQESAALVRAEAADHWPPAVVSEWDLSRARAALGSAQPR